MNARTNTLLSLLVLLQGAALLVLVADRLVPEAHAQDGVVRCDVQNWPDVLTNRGFATMRVRVEAVNGNLPVTVKDWETSDTLNTVVQDWNASDELRVNVTNWDTSDVVTVKQY
jgi:hypothetical protein